MGDRTERPHFKEPDAYEPGEVVVTEEQILARIKEVAPQIAARYRNQRLLVVGIMTGAFMVAPELIKELHRAGLDDLEYTQMKTEAYGDETVIQESGPRITQDMTISAAGRHILIVDDIADTRGTLAEVTALARSRSALSIETFTLFDKPDRKVADFEPTWTGFTVPNIWLQGHGMGTGNIGRGNPDVIKGPWPPDAVDKP